MIHPHFRAKLFHILHKPSPLNAWARYVNYFLAFLILANAIFVSLETVPAIAVVYKTEFYWFEVISTALFVIEYAARIWICVEQARYSKPFTGRIRYAVHPLPLLDLIVITTFWFAIDLRFLRVARMVRLLKVLRLENFEDSMERIGKALCRRKELILVALTMMLLCIYASASLLYHVEHTAQPNVFTSVPATFWWAMVTLTTIGYGDMVPISPLGKLFSGLVSIFGIGIFALPTAIVTAAIVEAGASDRVTLLCKHCGQPVHEESKLKL